MYQRQTLTLNHPRPPPTGPAPRRTCPSACTGCPPGWPPSGQPKFIGVTGLVNNPNLHFNDDFVTVTDESGRSSVKYFYSAEETLTTPTKDVSMPEPDVKFTLDNDTLNKLKKAAATLGHKELLIKANSGVLSLSIVENQNATSNAFSIDIDGEFKEDAVFNFIIDISNLKILPGDYDVEISSKLITQFTHKELSVKYWIALEKSSTYGV